MPVLVDKGRYLLVDLDPKRARKIGNSECAMLFRAPAGALTPRERADATGSSSTPRRARRRERPRASVPVIQALVDRISRATFEADLTQLVQLPTRLSTRTQFAAACDFVDQQLAALGYTTSRQTIQVNGSPSQNVIAVRTGTGPALARRRAGVGASRFDQPRGHRHVAGARRR